MALFGKNKDEKNPNRPAALNITSTAQLPGKDIIEYITKNDSIPKDIRERNWYKDYVQIALSQFTEEEARQFLKEVELKERMILSRRQKTPIWSFGLEAARQKDMDELYNLGLISSVRKATTGPDKKPIVESALTSSTLVETRQGITGAGSQPTETKGFMGKASKTLGIR